MKREREQYKDSGQKEEGKKQIKQWATMWKTLRVRRQRERTQKETITLHSLCSQIYPWDDMLHEHQDIYSRWQTHTKDKTKCQMSVRWSSFSLFVCCCFFLCTWRQETSDHVRTAVWNTPHLGKKQQGFCKKKKKITRRQGYNHTGAQDGACVEISANYCGESGVLMGSDSATQRWTVGLQLGDNPRSWEYINIAKDTILLGVCEHTLNHTQVGVGGAGITSVNGVMQEGWEREKKKTEER